MLKSLRPIYRKTSAAELQFHYIFTGLRLQTTTTMHQNQVCFMTPLDKIAYMLEMPHGEQDPF